LNEHAFCFVKQLVGLTASEASVALDLAPNASSSAASTSIYSPALHFLLVLQKRIVDCVFGVPFLLRYLELIFHQARQFLQHLLTRERDEKEVANEKEILLAGSEERKEREKEKLDSAIAAIQSTQATTTTTATTTAPVVSENKPASGALSNAAKSTTPTTSHVSHERVRVTPLDVLRYTLLGEGMKKLLKKLQHNAHFISEPDHVLRLLRCLVPLVETLDHVNTLFLHASSGGAKLQAYVMRM
jgi:hypothetical protein